MKTEIAEKWIEALTSGEYKQGRSGLKIDDSFCCLGVLCDIFHKETGEGRWINGTFFGPPNANGYTGSSSIQLITVVKDWAGMRSSAGGFHYDSDKDSLMSMNDTRKSFAEIAEVIKEKMEVL